jgi:hypothetical protein
MPNSGVLPKRPSTTPVPDFLARTLIEPSWADPEIPSLVASGEAEEALTPGAADTYVDGSA